MARYGMDYGRDFDRGGRGGRYEGWGGYGGRPAQPGYGGMRSDGWGSGSNWSDFPGEEGWYGEGYEGYPGGGYGGGAYGEDRGGYRGGRGNPEWGARPGPDRFGRGGYGSDFGGRGYAEGGYGGGSFGGAGYGAGAYGGGYAGRDTGYDTGAVGDRGGWGRGQQRMRAADLMTENPECVTPDTSLADVAKRMRDLDVGIIPVVDSQENRRLKGVITDRDIAVRAIADGKDGKAKVSDFMSSDVQTCNKNDAVGQVLDLMRSGQVRRVPITDREGRLVGIIAQADLAVDYAGSDTEREMRVQDTIERISEPANPTRGRMAAGGRTEG